MVGKSVNLSLFVLDGWGDFLDGGGKSLLLKITFLSSFGSSTLGVPRRVPYLLVSTHLAPYFWNSVVHHEFY